MRSFSGSVTTLELPMAQTRSKSCTSGHRINVYLEPQDKVVIPQLRGDDNNSLVGALGLSLPTLVFSKQEEIHKWERITF